MITLRSTFNQTPILFGLKFHVGSWVWHETPEEDWRTQWAKCKYNNEDEDNNPNTLNDKNAFNIISNSISLFMNVHKRPFCTILLGCLELVSVHWYEEMQTKYATKHCVQYRNLFSGFKWQRKIKSLIFIKYTIQNNPPMKFYINFVVYKK